MSANQDSLETIVLTLATTSDAVARKKVFKFYKDTPLLPFALLRAVGGPKVVTKVIATPQDGLVFFRVPNADSGRVITPDILAKSLAGELSRSDLNQLYLDSGIGNLVAVNNYLVSTFSEEVLIDKSSDQIFDLLQGEIEAHKKEDIKMTVQKQEQRVEIKWEGENFLKLKSLRDMTGLDLPTCRALLVARNMDVSAAFEAALADPTLMPPKPAPAAAPVQATAVAAGAPPVVTLAGSDSDSSSDGYSGLTLGLGIAAGALLGAAAVYLLKD